MNARHTITQLTRHIRTFARWQRDSQQRTARAHCARVTQGDEAHARLDTFWLPASGTAQQGKECKWTCVLQKPEKEASNLQSSPVLSPPEGDGKCGALHTGVSWGRDAGPSGRPRRKAGAPRTLCWQKPASLPAVAQAWALLQRARRRQDSPAPWAALSPRALGRGLWAGRSRGAAVCGREWRLGSRRHVLPI